MSLILGVYRQSLSLERCLQCIRGLAVNRRIHVVFAPVVYFQ